MRPRIVILQNKVLILEIEYALYFRIDPHYGQVTRSTGKLQFHLLKMIGVDMCIARGMDKLARP